MARDKVAHNILKLGSYWAILVEMNDAEFEVLLAGARDGDERAFSSLWRSLNPPVLRFLATIGGRDDVADVASVVWLEVIRGLARFEGDQRAFRSWLFTIARHRLIDVRRAQQRHPELPTQNPETTVGVVAAADAAGAIEDEWSTQAALSLISRLPPEQAEVVMLRVIAELDVAEVAAMLGKQPGTVRVIAHRGLRRLAELLEVENNQTAIGQVTP